MDGPRNIRPGEISKTQKVKFPSTHFYEAPREGIFIGKEMGRIVAVAWGRAKSGNYAMIKFQFHRMKNF